MNHFIVSFKRKFVPISRVEEKFSSDVYLISSKQLKKKSVFKYSSATLGTYIKHIKKLTDIWGETSMRRKRAQLSRR